MNIYLVPYTWIRHVSLGLVSGGAALLTWWFLVTYLVILGPSLYDSQLLYTQQHEGAYFLALTAGVLAFVSILGEGALYRRPLLRRIGMACLAALISWVTTLLGFMIVGFFTWVFVSGSMQELAGDASLVTLRYRLGQWIVAGLCSALGPLVVRRGSGFFSHLGAGLVAGSLAGATWHYLGFHMVGDYYLASAMAWFVWGTTHGLLIWEIPKDLYAGWIRVLSDNRYAYRIPVDRVDGGHSERFVGHFPRGLDLFLPVDKGVAELHTSFVVDGDQNYAVRGLSQRPTLVKRFLESIDLRYDAARPAPLQTELQQGDLILMSDGQTETWVEFVLIPKEER